MGTSRGTNVVGSSLLDVIVSGCNAILGVQVLRATPTADQSDPAGPVLGAGAPYSFAADATGHVTTCRDKSGMVVPLAGCLDAAAYSTAFKLTTDRVIFK
jgi:hypothetical protein